MHMPNLLKKLRDAYLQEFNILRSDEILALRQRIFSKASCALCVIVTLLSHLHLKVFSAFV